MKESYFKKHHKPILKSMANKYGLDIFSNVPGYYYLIKEQDDYHMIILFGCNCIHGVMRIELVCKVIQNWLLNPNKEYFDIIKENIDYEMGTFNKEVIGFSPEFWFGLEGQFRFGLIEDTDMEIFESSLERFIVDYCLPLIAQTSSLEVIRKNVCDIDRIKLLRKYCGGITWSTNSMILLTLLELDGVDNILKHDINFLTQMEEDEEALLRYKNMVTLLFDEANIERIKNAMNINYEESDKLVEHTIRKDNQELVDYPDDMVSQMYIVGEYSADIFELLGGKRQGNDEEEIYLGEEFDQPDHITVGDNGLFTIVSMPFDGGTIFDACDDNGSFSTMEKKLVELFPDATILLLFQADVNGIAYSKIVHRRKVQSALYMMDDSMSINGELTTNEQKLIDKAEDDFTKVSNLWHHHFKSITGLDTPYCQEFASIKMKEI